MFMMVLVMLLPVLAVHRVATVLVMLLPVLAVG
jgi:hypothetical protein